MSDVVKKLGELIDLIKNKEPEEFEEVDDLDEVLSEVLEDEDDEEDDEEVPEIPSSAAEIIVPWEEVAPLWDMEISLGKLRSEFASMVTLFEKNKMRALVAMQDLEDKKNESIRELEKLYNIEEQEKRVLLLQGEGENAVFK